MSRGFFLLSLLSLAAACRSGKTEPPCAGGGWGAILDPAGSVHVQSGGDDKGDGTPEAPLASLSAALDLARTGAQRTIAIGAGEFPAALDLLETDSGLTFEACGQDETTLVPETDGVPQLKVTAATDVAVTGLTLQGGDRPLWVWGGGELTVSAVAVADANWTGFVVDGPYTIVIAQELTVRGTRSVGGEGGYGVEIDGATVSWEGGAILENTAAGVVASGDTASLSLLDVEISDTLPDDDGRFGRGVQIQSYATAVVEDCLLERNQDAAIFSLLGQDVLVEGAQITTVVASSGDGGDGIVLTGIDSDGRQLDPASFVATLTDNVIDNAVRAGVVLERVTATLTGNQVTTSGQTLVSQEGAVLSGPDVVTELTEPLPLRRDLFAPLLEAR
jgi:hypothetical protein